MKAAVRGPLIATLSLGWLLLTVGIAHAVCTYSSATLTSASSVSAGTYTPPTTPSPTTPTITVRIVTTGNLTCTLAVAFKRATLPATLAGPSGATMPYTFTNGTSTVLFTTAPPATFFSISVPGGATTSVTLTGAILQENPSGLIRAGAYTDALTLQVFSRTGSTATGAALTSIAFTVTGTVNSACSIGTTFSGAAPVINQTLATTSTGNVSVTAIPVSIGTIACNKGANIQLQSQKGALLGPAAATGFQNYIDYIATTTGFPTAQALVSANIITGVVTVVTGTLVITNASVFSVAAGVTITPTANVQKLRAGSYSDVLRLTVTPQ
jgi:hypothetical protein